jgi:hypothetical protein
MPFNCKNMFLMEFFKLPFCLSVLSPKDNNAAGERRGNTAERARNGYSLLCGINAAHDDLRSVHISV